MPVNPFAIPGPRQATLSPLDPFRHPEHADFYVDVDGAAEAFRHFQRAFAGSSGWRADGALAIASGPPQTGKSALLNRCVHWLRTQLEMEAVHPSVVDLRTVRTTHAEPIADRMRTVCRHLVTTLVHERLLTDASALDSQEPAEILRYLPYTLAKDDHLIVVLLPPSADLPEELVQYAQLVPRGVLFLGETDYADRLDGVVDRLSQVPARTEILRLGPLRLADGDRFYRHRRAMHPPGAAIPEPSPELLTRLLSLRPMSIGELQRLLYDVYDELVAEPSVTTVTFDMIAAFYFRKTAFGASR